jgi:hypothetical protein
MTTWGIVALILLLYGVLTLVDRHDARERRRKSSKTFWD